MKSINLNNEFKTNVPSDWEVNLDGNTITLYDPNHGVGAVQCSYYLVSEINSINLVTELEDYLEDKYHNVKVKSIDGYAYFCTIDEENTYWRYWLLKGVEGIMFISYNCKLAERDKEDVAVNGIIKSISR